MAFTNSWDENAPAGTDSISAGDNEIRQFKLDIRQRLDTILSSATALANNIDPLIILPRVEVSKNSAAAVGDRRTLNLIEGANVGLTIADDSGGNEIDVTIKSSIEVSKNSAAAVGARRTLNLIEGTNVTLTVADDAGGDEIDVTIAAAGANTALDVTWTTVTDAVTATGTTNIVSVTEAGVLLGIGINVSTAILGGTPDSTMEITIDGGTTRSFSVLIGQIEWNASQWLMVSSHTAGGGSAVRSHGFMPLNVPYATSLTVAHNIVDAASSTGAYDITVVKGLEL